MALIGPNKVIAENVFIFTTTRLSPTGSGGASQFPRDSFNVAKHVGDEDTAVNFNRDILKRVIESQVGEDVTMRWLSQTHSDILVDDETWSLGVEADAVMTRRVGQVCLVMTADCLPVVIVSKSGAQVASLHCGWKGLHQRLISKTLAMFEEPVTVWLGPAISQANYEVDTAFYERFMDSSPEYRRAFEANRAGHYKCDLYQIARIELALNNVTMENIFGGEYCTFADERFYSHRQNPNTGRQVTGVVIRKQEEK